MVVTVHIGNLSFEATEHELEQALSRFAKSPVIIRIMRNRFTEKSLGYAFADFPDKDSAEKAIQELNGVELSGRTLRMALAKPQNG